MSALDTTILAVIQHKWRIVLLATRSKRPIGNHWRITTDPQEIQQHVVSGGNIGLVCGPDSGVIVLDFDKPGALAEICTELGPILPWVRTGSKKFHVYEKWEDGLPAKIMWHGEKVGEVQRGPSLQHVVVPPSIHPDTGFPYTWLEDPRQPLPVLPNNWRSYLLSGIPSFIPIGDLSGHPEAEVWQGPPVEEILRRAAAQPGAKRRRYGIKFQCPGCAKEGHDRSRDNAIVYDDGRWGCALDPEHRKDIGGALGVVSLSKIILEEDEDALLDIALSDLN